MTTFTAEYTSTKARIAKALAIAGWTLGSARDMDVCCLIARKDYETAVGEKTASLSLEPWSCSLMLVGMYESEGRNILGADMLRVSEDMNDEALNAAVVQFVAKVEKEIDGSYARRLHLRYPQTA